MHLGTLTHGAPMVAVPGRTVGWLGPLDLWHRIQPAPFNPAYDPGAKDRYARVTGSMEQDGYYDSHTRAECAAEWRRRYDQDKQG